MKTLFFILASLMLGSHCYGLELSPEDGSRAFKYFVFHPGRNEKVAHAIEEAFRFEGITPVRSRIYDWLQDILFVSSEGEIILMPDYYPSSSYFSDFTIGVFDDEGGTGRLRKIKEKNVDFQLDKELNFRKSATLYLEGGSAISGKFKAGENYLIILKQRFLKSLRAFNSNNRVSLSQEEFKEAIYKDLSIKPENLVLLDDLATTSHLDLYMKALPGGVILLDDPFTKGQRIKEMLRDQNLSQQERQGLEDILNYEIDPMYQNRREAYLRQIKYVQSVLEKKFQVHMVTGRFFAMKKYEYGTTLIEEKVNFFNGVNGINREGQSYFITNMSRKIPALENLWYQLLTPFNYAKEHVHFVGDYSGGAWLDCMGVLVP